MRTPTISPGSGGIAAARCRRLWLICCTLLAAAAASTPKLARADEGGVGFWQPGTFDSFAAVPGEPGWSVETTYYHSSLTAATNVGVAREIEDGRFNPTVNATLTTHLKSTDDQLSFSPTYTFASPVLG